MMKLSDIKNELSVMGISSQHVRTEFGDLRLRVTWEAAYQKYCCFEQLPIIEAIAKSDASNNIVAFMPPAPPTIIAPPITPTPPPEEENNPPTTPTPLPDDDTINPGDDRLERLPPLPIKYLPLLFKAVCNSTDFGDVIIQHDEPTILLKDETHSKVWVGANQILKRLLAYPLSPPVALATPYDRGSTINTPSRRSGSRSPPR